MSAALAAATITAGFASAGTSTLQYEIAQGVQSGFGFSVLHIPSVSNGHVGYGSVAFRMVGTFELEYDDMADTVTFTEFDAALFNDNNLNTATGALAGSMELVSSDAFSIGAGDLVAGSATFHIELNDDTNAGNEGAGHVTLNFKAIAYNALANKFNTSNFMFGLWGATADVFGEGPVTPIGDTGLTRLGMDLLGKNPTTPPVVPTPSAFGLGLAGAIGLGGVRRRR